jgi:hypothetical protein
MCTRLLTWGAGRPLTGFASCSAQPETDTTTARQAASAAGLARRARRGSIGISAGSSRVTFATATPATMT